MLFFRVFLNTLGFLSAILIFAVVVNIAILLFSERNLEYFSLVNGDKQSKNIIAVLNINGPILGNFVQLFNQPYYNYIDPKEVKKNLII